MRLVPGLLGVAAAGAVASLAMQGPRQANGGKMPLATAGLVVRYRRRPEVRGPVPGLERHRAFHACARGLISCSCGHSAPRESEALRLIEERPG